MAKPARISEWLRETQGARSPDPFTSRLNNDTVIDGNSTVSNWEYLLGALRSRAPGQWSQNVMALSQHMLSGVFLAVNTLQKFAYCSEMKLMERTYDPQVGDLELPHTEPVCELYNNPNNDDDWGDIAAQLVQQMSLTATGLQWVPVFPDQMLPSEMYVIPTSTALPWPPSPVYPNGSYLIQPYYPYGPFSTIPSYQSAAGARIPAEQIIRMHSTPHPVLRYDGLAVLTGIQRIVDTVEAMDTARWTTQQKGVDPSIVISFDPELNNPSQADLIRMRSQLEAVAAGPVNAGKLMFNPFGGKVDKISHSPSEMAWESGWAQLMSFEQAAFGVPKGVSGMDDDASFATLYARLKQFSIISLNPILRVIANKNRKHCIRPNFGRDLYMSLKPERVDDEDLLEKQVAVDLPALVRTKNEWRKTRGLAPIPGPKGEEWAGTDYIAQMEMAGIQQEQSQPSTGGRPTDDMSQDKMQRRNGQVPKRISMNGQERQHMAQRRENENGRPVNIAGQGSRGPIKSLMSNNRLADILDRAKVNGYAVPIDACNDGAAEYLKQLNHR